MVKNLPAMQETRVPSLGREDPLEKEMATHFSILTWEIPWTEEPGRLHGVAKSGTQLSDSFFKKKKKSEPDHLQQFLEEVSSSKVILF